MTIAGFIEAETEATAAADIGTEQKSAAASTASTAAAKPASVTPEADDAGNADDADRKRQLTGKESRQKGTIRSHVVVEYARRVGMQLSIAVMVSLVLMQITRNGCDWWLSQWTADVDDGSAGPGSNWIKRHTL